MARHHQNQCYIYCVSVYITKGVVTTQTSRGPRRGSQKGNYKVKGNNGAIAHCHLNYGSLLFTDFHRWEETRYNKDHGDE